jgi:hypothetical protein
VSVRSVDVGLRVCGRRRPTLIIVNCGIAVLQQETMLRWQFRTARIRVNAHANGPRHEDVFFRFMGH